jgi:hypothetical protein
MLQWVSGAAATTYRVTCRWPAVPPEVGGCARSGPSTMPSESGGDDASRQFLLCIFYGQDKRGTGNTRHMPNMEAEREGA